jgi:hypothetical protein
LIHGFIHCFCDGGIDKSALSGVARHDRQGSYGTFSTTPHVGSNESGVGLRIPGTTSQGEVVLPTRLVKLI